MGWWEGGDLKEEADLLEHDVAELLGPDVALRVAQRLVLHGRERERERESERRREGEREGGRESERERERERENGD